MSALDCERPLSTSLLRAVFLLDHTECARVRKTRSPGVVRASEWTLRGHTTIPLPVAPTAQSQAESRSVRAKARDGKKRRIQAALGLSGRPPDGGGSRKGVRSWRMNAASSIPSIRATRYGGRAGGTDGHGRVGRVSPQGIFSCLVAEHRIARRAGAPGFPQRLLGIGCKCRARLTPARAARRLFVAGTWNQKGLRKWSRIWNRRFIPRLGRTHCLIRALPAHRILTGVGA